MEHNPRVASSEAPRQKGLPHYHCCKKAARCTACHGPWAQNKTILNLTRAAAGANQLHLFVFSRLSYVSKSRTTAAFPLPVSFGRLDGELAHSERWLLAVVVSKTSGCGGGMREQRRSSTYPSKPTCGGTRRNFSLYCCCMHEITLPCVLLNFGDVEPVGQGVQKTEGSLKTRTSQGSSR